MLGKTIRSTASLALSALLFDGVSVADDTDVNQRKPDGSTPLQWAVYDVDAAEVGRLLRAGADVRIANDYGATPMSLAAEIAEPKMIELLVARGAAVNARSAVRDYQRHIQAEGRPKSLDTGGLTPLLYAARENCREWV